MDMDSAIELLHEIRTGRLLLRPFRESDLDGLYAFLSQLKDDEFEGYPGITRENCREHLQYRLGSEEFFAMELLEGGKVIGDISCLRREQDTREVGFRREAHFRENVFFRRGAQGRPIWKDTYVYAMLADAASRLCL